jgi:Protein of unknown function (DUF4012)
LTNKKDTHKLDLHRLKVGYSSARLLGSSVGGANFTQKINLIITFFLLLFIVTGNTLGQISNTKELISVHQNNILGKITTLLDLSSQDRAEQYSDIRSEIQTTLKPINSFWNIKPIVDRDIDSIFNLLDSWLDKIQPLTKYKFSQTGFIFPGDVNRSFTDDLEVFLNSIPQLKSKTEKIYINFWYYKVILITINTQKYTKIFKALEDFLVSLNFIFSIKENILSLLGHYTSQKVVIFNQNIGEARPTGGFYGSYIPITVSKGKLNLQQSNSIYFVGGSSAEQIISNPLFWQYGIATNNYTPSGIQNLQISNCFPDVAKNLENEFKKSTNGFNIDQIIFLNPNLIKNLLSDNFNLNIPEIGSLNTLNFDNEIERLTSLENANNSNPKASLSLIVLGLITQLNTIILNSLYSRDLMLWAKNDSQESILKNLNFAGSQTCQNESQIPVISPEIFNMSGDKRGLVGEYATSLQKINNTFNVKLNQFLPENKLLQRGFNELTANNAFALQIPKSATNLKIYSNFQSKRDFTRQGFYQFIKDLKQKYTIPQDVQTIINSSYDLPDGGWVYTQPDGSQVLGAYISDNPVGDTTVEFEFTLPEGSGDVIQYYGQPGLNKPSLNIGDGLEVWKNPDVKYINNAQTIQSGVTLKLK